jgi:hypothetical protein
MLDGDIPPCGVIFDGTIKFLIQVRKEAVTPLLVHHTIHGGPKVMAGVRLVDGLERIFEGELFVTELGGQQAGEGVVFRGGDDVADPRHDRICEVVVRVPEQMRLVHVPE